MAHIRLNTHPSQGGRRLPGDLGRARSPIRGPVVGTVGDASKRNAIGAHSGSYGIYRALAIAAQELKADHRPDLTNTSPAEPIGPFAKWSDPNKIVSLDPWGHMVAEVFADELAAGWDIRPTIAVTKAHVEHAGDQARDGRRPAAGRQRHPARHRAVMVTKAAIEPVWWLPGIAERFGVDEADLRRTLFEQTGGMYHRAGHPAATSSSSCRRSAARRSISSATPQLGEARDQDRLPRPRRVQRLRRLRLRHLHLPALPGAWHRGVHRDGADRAASGSSSTTARKAAPSARSPSSWSTTRASASRAAIRRHNYFVRTECVAGVQDMRFQELMPDVLHWLGVGASTGSSR